MFSLNSNNLQKNKVQCPTTSNIKRCTTYNLGNDIYIAHYKRNVRVRLIENIILFYFII